MSSFENFCFSCNTAFPSKEAKAKHQAQRGWKCQPHKDGQQIFAAKGAVRSKRRPSRFKDDDEDTDAIPPKLKQQKRDSQQRILEAQVYTQKLSDFIEEQQHQEQKAPAAAEDEEETLRMTAKPPAATNTTAEGDTFEKAYEDGLEWDRRNAIVFEQGLIDDQGSFLFGGDDDNDNDNDSVAGVAATNDDEAPTASRPVLEDGSLGVLKNFELEDQDRFMYPLTNSQRCQTIMYEFADRRGATRAFVDDFMKILRQLKTHMKFDVYSTQMFLRDAHFGRVAKATHFLPSERIQIHLEHGRSVVVQRYNLHDQLRRHLISATYADLNNLNVDKNDPWSCKGYKNNQSVISHPMEYKAYAEGSQRYLDEVDGDDNRHHFMANDLYIDALSKHLRSTEPLVMVNGALTEKARGDPANWIILGYMPFLEEMSGAERRSYQNRLGSADFMSRCYHHALSVLLEPLIELQQNPIAFDIRRGSRVKRAVVHIKIKNIAVDNKAADILCAKKMSKDPSIMRMTRKCLTTFQQSAEPNHVCHRLADKVYYQFAQFALGNAYGIFKLMPQEGNQHPPQEGDQQEGDQHPIIMANEVDMEVNAIQSIQALKQAQLGKKSWEHLKDICRSISMRPSSAHISDNFDDWSQMVQFEENGDVAIEDGRMRKERRSEGDSKTLSDLRKFHESLHGDILKNVLGTKVVDVPTQRLIFCDELGGLHGSLTADILHALKSGVLQKTLGAVFDPMPDGQKMQLDMYVEEVFGSGINKAYHGESYPRISFMGGYTKLTELTGDERFGQLLVLAILLATPNGRSLLEDRFKIDFDEQRRKRQERMSKRFNKVEEEIDQVSGSDRRQRPRKKNQSRRKKRRFTHLGDRQGGVVAMRKMKKKRQHWKICTNF